MTAAPSSPPTVREEFLRRSVITAMKLSFWLFYLRCPFPDVRVGVQRFEPWAHLNQVANRLQARENLVILKARQLGISWLIAAYALWVAMFQEYARVLCISKGQLEADELLAKMWRIYEHLPWYLKEFAPVTKHNISHPARLEFSNGAEIIALPSTEDAGRSFTATLVLCDEAAFHPWGETNFSAYQPTLDGGGQLVLVSTANGSTGFFARMYRNAKRAGASSFRALFIPWWARPSRQRHVEGQPTGEADPGWLETQRADYAATPAKFQQEFPSNEVEAFVANAGLVFGLDVDGIPIFDERLNVIDVPPVPWEQCQGWYAGIDWGGGDPTACNLFGVTPSRKIIQYFEFHRTGPVTIPEIQAFLEAHRPPDDYDEIACGQDESNSIATLAAYYGDTRTLVRAADVRRGEGLGNVKQVLKERRLLHLSSCTHTIDEYSQYAWLVHKDSNTKEDYATRSGVDNHADHADTTRYAVMAIIADELSYRESIDAYVLVN